MNALYDEAGGTPAVWQDYGIRTAFFAQLGK